MREYVAKAVDVTPERPILIDRFLVNALEFQADAMADGKDAFVPAVMEHIEQAGSHSGDSACVIRRGRGRIEGLGWRTIRDIAVAIEARTIVVSGRNSSCFVLAWVLLGTKT
jgi:hypothetical protein